MRFPDTFIEDLKRQADIVRVVGDYVQLKKKGQNWMANCPFHNEKSASFSVSPSKNIFYCFGCHKGGSVLNFVMEVESVTFPEAVRIVAQKANVTLPVMEHDEKYQQRRSEAEDVIQLNQWAMLWWETQLAVSGEGGLGRTALMSRGLTEQTCKTFHIGYAPDDWNELTNHLKSKGATDEQIMRSGLVVKKDDGGYYDRFRGRLMFPVFNTQGHPIAFGGRILKGEGAKYLNSPETPAFIKGLNLFGLNFTRESIKRQGFAILVEGFLDLVVPHQHGVANLVASLGTSLTPDQVKLLSRFTRKVVVNYDGDKAGVSAAKKSIEILLREGFEVKVLVLPDGADPDEFIRKHGVAEYTKRRGQSLPYINFVIEQSLVGRNLNNPADKERAVNEILPYIRILPSSLQQREYFDLAMNAYQINDRGILLELWNSVKTGREVKDSALGRLAMPSPAEKRLLELLLSEPAIRERVCPILHEYVTDDLPTAALFEAIRLLDDNGQEVGFDSLNRILGEDSASAELLPVLLMADPSKNPEGEVSSCLNALWLLQCKKKTLDLRERIRQAEQHSDQDLQLKLSQEHLELARERNRRMQLGRANA